MLSKTCTKCETPITRYQTKSGRWNNPICKPCSASSWQAWYNRNPEKAVKRARQANVKSNYGLHPTAYEFILDKYGAKCNICEQPFESDSKRCLDHCHITDKIRGVLCNKCNMALGLFTDNTQILRKAIGYLNERG